MHRAGSLHHAQAAILPPYSPQGSAPGTLDPWKERAVALHAHLYVPTRAAREQEDGEDGLDAFVAL